MPKKASRKNNDDDSLSDLKVKVARLETDMGWIKKTMEGIKRTIEKVEKRTWWVLGSVVVLGIIAILVGVLT